jgi:deoxycytidylate deaminase
VSLSDRLKQLYQEETGNDQYTRSELQTFGNQKREEFGSAYFANLVIDHIKENPQIEKWVIDSFRNPEEVKAFSREFTNFYLLGIFADKDVRWNRIQSIYNRNLGAFESDEERDRNETISHGQRVSECFLNSDLVIANNEQLHQGSQDYTLLTEKIRNYLNLLENPYSISPREEEAIMAIAYANSQRSSCLKRKVGAAIIDDYGNLFSSGYNEVPVNSRSCKNLYGQCYRDKFKADLATELTEHNCTPLLESIWGQVKNLERCQALHAEENAILNVARFGSSVALREATLYTTTYPCNMCANKIAQVGIKRIVYFEPYPQEEAKRILANQGIKQKPFEGITFRAYFRVFGE